VDVHWRLLFGNPLVHTSVLMRRRVVEEVGRYNPAYTYAQDFDLWSRIAATRRVANLESPLVRYRSHAKSMSETLAGATVAEPEAIRRRNLKELLPNLTREDVATLAVTGWGTRVLPRNAQANRAFERYAELRDRFLSRLPDSVAGEREIAAWRYRQDVRASRGLVDALVRQSRRRAALAALAAARHRGCAPAREYARQLAKVICGPRLTDVLHHLRRSDRQLLKGPVVRPSAPGARR